MRSEITAHSQGHQLHEEDSVVICEHKFCSADDVSIKSLLLHSEYFPTAVQRGKTIHDQGDVMSERNCLCRYHRHLFWKGQFLISSPSCILSSPEVIKSRSHPGWTCTNMFFRNTPRVPEDSSLCWHCSPCENAPMAVPGVTPSPCLGWKGAQWVLICWGSAAKASVLLTS